MKAKELIKEIELQLEELGVDDCEIYAVGQDIGYVRIGDTWKDSDDPYLLIEE